MITISTYMLCDSIGNINSPDGGNIPQLIAPRTVLRPELIPGSFSFGLVVGVENVDLKQNNKIMFKIFSPYGDLLQDSGENELPAITQEDTIPKKHQGYTLSIDIRNLSIEHPGVYTFSLYINGETVGTKDIPIYQR